MKKAAKKAIEDFHDIYHLISDFHFEQGQAIPPHFGGDEPFTMAQIRVVRMVSERPQLSVGELAGHFCMARSSFSILLNKMERDGYLERRLDSADKRSYKLELTQKGKDLEEWHMRVDRQLFGELLDELAPPEELDRFLALLRVLADRYVRVMKQTPSLPAAPAAEK